LARQTAAASQMDRESSYGRDLVIRRAPVPFAAIGGGLLAATLAGGAPYSADT